MSCEGCKHLRVLCEVCMESDDEYYEKSCALTGDSVGTWTPKSCPFIPATSPSAAGNVAE